jgi:hypothetical protein
MSLSALIALIRGDQPSFEYVAQGFEEGFDLAAANEGDILQFDPNGVPKAVGLAALNLPWQTWTLNTMSASGSMTVSSISPEFAIYTEFGGEAEVRGQVNFTTGGTASTSIFISGLPVNFAQEATSFGRSAVGRAAIINAGFQTSGTYSGGVCQLDTTNSVLIQGPVGGSWTLGANRRIMFAIRGRLA